MNRRVSNFLLKGVVLAVVFLSTYTIGITGTKLELIGRSGGAYYEVAVQGNYAYIAEGGGLSILDISNPLQVKLVGMLSFLDCALGIAVSGNYAYIANGLYGLQIVDISDPTNPKKVGTQDTGYAQGVTLYGNYAYVADNWMGMDIIDITNPKKPNLVSVIDTPGVASNIVVNGSYAYLADDWYGLRIFDVSNPYYPTEVGYCNTGSAYDVAINGNYVYLACDYGMRIIDVSNPGSPIEVGYTEESFGCPSVAVSGKYAYLSNCWGVRIFDISIPTDPLETGYYLNTRTGAVNWVEVSGNYAYLACDNTGLRIVYIGNHSNPIEVGHYYTLGYASNVAVRGNYAYVADGIDELRILNIANPSKPTEVGYYYIPDGYETHNVAVNGNYAYVVTHGDGLHIINISNPNNPYRVGYIDIPGTADVAVNGDYAYIANGVYGLHVVDVSNPSSPIEVGSCGTQGCAYGVALQGHYAYIMDGGDSSSSSGLRVIDISDPHHPVMVGSCTIPSEGIMLEDEDVAVNGDYAYVGDGYGGFRIINISNPKNPVEVGSLDSNAYGVAVNGNYAFVAEDGSKLQIIDISNFSNPTTVRLYYLPGLAWGVTVIRDYIYFSDYHAGLWIFRFTAPQLQDVPDIKLLKGQTQENALCLNNYLQNITSANWDWSSKNNVANLTIDGNGWVDYLTSKYLTANQDTITVTALGIGSDESVLKYSTYLFARFPDAVVDNGQKVLNCDINLQNYISKGTGIGYPGSYPYKIHYQSSSDTGKLNISFSGDTIQITPKSALTKPAEIIITTTPDSTSDDWDKEIIHVSEVLNPNSEFSSENDIAQYWYVLPLCGAESLPDISWENSVNGYDGVLKLSFSTASQGAKVVYNQELDIQPYTWYTLCCAFNSSAAAGNKHQVSGQLFAVDNASGTSESGAFLRQPGQMQNSTWWAPSAYIYSNTATRLRPMIVFKNNGSSGNMYLDYMRVYESSPITERVRGALSKISLPNGSFDLNTSGWLYGFPMMGADPNAPLPGYSVVSVGPVKQSKVLQLSFTQALQGIKITSDPVVTIVPMKSTKLSWKAYGEVLNSSRSISGRIYCIDTAGNGDLSDVIGPNGVSVGMPNEQWVTYTAVGTPMLNTETQARVQLVAKSNNAAHDVVYLDDITLEQENDSPYYWDHTLF